MDLVIEQELESIPTTFEELAVSIRQSLGQGNFVQALHDLDKILEIAPDSLAHLNDLRYVLYTLPTKLEYTKYYSLILTYRIFDHKTLQGKIFEIIFDLEKNIKPLDNPLFHALLKSSTVTHLSIENLLCNARQESLHLLLNNKTDQIKLELLKALVLQCYLNEHVWHQDQFSVQQIISLLSNTNTTLTRTQELDYYHKCVILISACYFSLAEIISFYPVIASACEVDSDLLYLYNLEITSRKQEDQLKYTIPQITAIDKSLSSQVRAQYEDYPYPRWICVEIKPTISFADYLMLYYGANAKQIEHLNTLDLDNPQVLIAGSGTGSQPLMISHLANSKILALDLSLSSLAYAKRQTELLAIKNISYAQGDLTKIEQYNQKFDYIEAIGVLHHTRNIEHSLRKLCEVLKPHAIIRLGLYSATARAELKFIKQFVKENNYTADLIGVRKLRQDIKDRIHLKEFAWALNFSDFYTTSMCIDLLFHTHEITSTILDIKQLLRKNNLKFISFELPYYANSKNLYKAAFPDDELMINLNNWHKFEQMYPETFRSMYCFSAQKIS